MVSGMSCPDEKLHEPKALSRVRDIEKNNTEPVISAICHPYGRNIGSKGGCDPSVNRRVPIVIKRAQVIARVAIAFLICGDFVRLRANKNRLVGYTVAAKSRTSVKGRNESGRNRLNPIPTKTNPS